MAEVIISWPALTLSGLPAERMILKLPKSIRRKAIPPPIPTRIRVSKPIKIDGSLVSMSPIAVDTTPLPPNPVPEHDQLPETFMHGQEAGQPVEFGEHVIPQLSRVTT